MADAAGEAPVNTDAVQELEALLGTLGSIGVPAEELAQPFERIAKSTLNVAVLALVKAGKSTFLNALIGKEFLPATPEPETSVLVRVQHDVSSPEGQLLDPSGAVVAEGRADILEYLRAKNLERRQRALDISQAATVAAAAATTASTAAIAVTRAPQREDDDNMFQRLGCYTSSTGEQILIRGTSDKDIVLTYVTVESGAIGGIMGAMMGSSGTKKSRSGRLMTISSGTWTHRADLKSDASPSRNVSRSIFLRFHPEGLECYVKKLTGMMRTSQSLQMKMISSAARVLQATCIDGSAAGWFDSPCAVPRQVGMRSGSPLLTPSCFVGEHFVVQQLDPEWIQDADGGWMQRFSYTGKPNFDLVSETVDDSRLPPQLLADFEAALREPSFQESLNIDLPEPEVSIEVETLVLHVPVQSFTSGGSTPMMLFDTPGPNEANAGLERELRAAVKTADVVLYLLDYTKLGTDDEKQMFENLRSYNSSLLASVNLRFWFILNKIDVKPENQDLDTVKKSVAERISNLCPDMAVTLDQIFPISALDAFLGRQGEDDARVNSDLVFQEEFMKRAGGRMYKEAYDEEIWPRMVKKWAPKMFSKSNVAVLERRVFQPVILRKHQILTESLCDDIDRLVASHFNECVAELSSLQVTAEEFGQRLHGAQQIHNVLEAGVKRLRESNLQDKHVPRAVKHVGSLVGNLAVDAKLLIPALLQPQNGKIILPQRFEHWQWLIEPEGTAGRSAAGSHITGTGEAREIKFATKDEAAAFVRSRKKIFMNLFSRLLQQCLFQISEACTREMLALQKELQRDTQEIMREVLRTTKQEMKIELQMETLLQAQISEQEVMGKLQRMLAPEDVKARANTKTSQEQHVTVERRRAWWYWFGIRSWEVEVIHQKTVTTIESYSVKLVDIESHLKAAVNSAEESLEKEVEESVGSLFLDQVLAACGAADRRCVELLRMLCKNREQMAGSKEELEARLEGLKQMKDKLGTIKESVARIRGRFGSSSYVPCIFGIVGKNVSLNAASSCAERTKNVNEAVCFSLLPVAAVNGRRYFELEIMKVAESTLTMAVGFSATNPNSLKQTSDGHLDYTDACAIPRVWLAGYDRKASAGFIQDGVEVEPSPVKAWRPLLQLKSPGIRVGVLWVADPGGQATFKVLVDGEKVVEVPTEHYEGDLWAVVDLQGRVQSVALVSEPELPDIS